MKNVSKQTGAKGSVTVGKQRSYNEIVEFLDQHWTTNKTDKTLSVIKKLDNAFGNLSQKLDTIVVGGTNGKSLTINFTTQLLKQEGLKVGSFYAPHTLTYNERFSLNSETISNKIFTDIANDVLNTVQTLGLEANSLDILVMISLIYFTNNNADVAVLEISDSESHPARICSPKIVGITRVTADHFTSQDQVATSIKNTLEIVKKGTHVISADQSKINLKEMHDISTAKNGVWAMPIRKLAQLIYPFEQLHGRCAALAERMAYIYVNTFANKDAIVVTETLLTKQKGQRGRPTLEAKRQSELNPKKTIDQFWKDTVNQLPGRFQLLDKEKPSLLIDNANNLDAFKNLLLGIRLLHYQRPLKGLTLILGCNNPHLNVNEFLKLLRYFFKKTSGQVIVCPVSKVPGHEYNEAWDTEKVTNDIKSMKIKARSCQNFKEAFEVAQKTVDERHGLLVITGSDAIITDYWKYKGIKKL